MRLHRKMIGLWSCVSAALLLLTEGGCSARSSDSLPTNDVARSSVETALKAWSDGGKPGPLPGTTPQIQVIDTPWSLGDRLKSYEIVGEDQSAAQMRFSVRLTLAKPDRVQDAEYYVIGRDPVMVFRDEDYRRNINMVDGPKLPTAKKPGGRRAR